MNNARRYHARIVIGGKIYVRGGRDQNDVLVPTMECFDPKVGEWRIVKRVDRTKIREKQAKGDKYADIVDVLLQEFEKVEGFDVDKCFGYATLASGVMHFGGRF